MKQYTELERKLKSERKCYFNEFQRYKKMFFVLRDTLEEIGQIMNNYTKEKKEDFDNKLSKLSQYYCEKCGSSDVEEQYWCKVNTIHIVSVVEESDVWCCQCEQMTTLEEK